MRENVIADLIAYDEAHRDDSWALVLRAKEIGATEAEWDAMMRHLRDAALPAQVRTALQDARKAGGVEPMLMPVRYPRVRLCCSTCDGKRTVSVPEDAAVLVDSWCPTCREEPVLLYREPARP